MTTSLPGLHWKPGELALGERLGHEGRGRINHRLVLGTSFLAAVEAEADHVALAWAHYTDKVQMHAVQIAFAELYHRYPKEADRTDCSRSLSQPGPQQIQLTVRSGWEWVLNCYGAALANTKNIEKGSLHTT